MLELKDLKEQTHKFVIKVTMYNSWGNAHFIVSRNQRLVYVRGNPKFNDMFDKHVENYALDFCAFNDKNEVLYERDFEKESQRVPVKSSVEVVIVKQPAQKLGTTKELDMVTKLLEGKVKYNVSDDVDKTIHLSKMSDEKKIELATKFKEEIKVTSSKEDIAVALSQLNGEHPDDLIGTKSKKVLLQDLETLCTKILFGGVNG